MSFNINRVAQLCNLVSKPELNGVYVTVESYNRIKDRYVIRTLVVPNSSAEVVSILVKRSSLEFVYTADFTSTYRRAHTQNKTGTFDLDECDEGIIFDFSRTLYTFDSFTPGGIVGFDHSCRLIGVPTRSFAELITVFPDTVGVRFLPGKDVIVQFENIHFTAKDRQIYLKHAKLVKFRNCRFGNGKEGAVLQCGSTAVFENCLFEHTSFTAIWVEGENSHACILNCTFRGCVPAAVRVLNEGTATIIHCTFVDCATALHTGPHSPDVQYINCSATGGLNTSLLFRDGSNGIVKGSVWLGCKREAMMVEGLKRSTVVVEDCVMDYCLSAIGTMSGKVEVKLVNTHIAHCIQPGVKLSMTTVGSVELMGCTFSHNSCNVVNWCGVHCAVTIDGVRQTEQDAASTDIVETYSSRKPTLRVLRARKITNTGEVQCANCSVVEPLEVKFNKCSKCKSVCYCTKECQKSHWKSAHQEECDKFVYL